MDPRHLLQLATVLDRGSITAAAEHLGLTQPTLTRNMATLEMQAGGTLFSRSRFGVRSTALGEQLARLGRAIQRDTLAARNAAGRHRLGLREQLHVGVGPLIGAGLMSALAKRMLDAHPHLTLTITSTPPTEVQDGLVDARFDVAIAPALFHQPPAGVERVLLADDSIGVFAADAHPLHRLQRPLAPADFAEAEWLNIGTASPFQNAVDELLALNGIGRARTRMATHGDAVILLQLLTLGRHLAVLPRLPLALMRERFALTALPLAVPGVARPLYLWVQRPLMQQAEVRTLIDAARELASQTVVTADRGAIKPSNGTGSRARPRR